MRYPKYLLGTALGLVGLLSFMGLLIMTASYWLPSLMSFYTQRRTGYTLHIDAAQLQLWRGYLSFRGLALHNPHEFPDKAFVHIPELTVHLRLASLFKRPLHIREATLKIDHITFVQNQQGLNNVQTFANRLKGVQKTQDAPKTADKTQPADEVYFERLQLHIGTLGAFIYDENAHAPLSARSNLGIQRQYTDVSNPVRTLGPLALEVSARGLALLGKLALQKTTRELTQGLGENLGGVLKKTAEGLRGLISPPDAPTSP
jgi:uncharacterized protein involved in outer membrane biogenesis